MILNNISVARNAARGATMAASHNDIPIVTVGRGSCIENMSVRCGLPVNLHIGQFCTLAGDITFMLQVGRDCSRVTTSDDQLVALLPGAILNAPRTIKGQIILQNDVWVGHGATVMGGVLVGNGAVVAVNSHVVRDVPPYAIVGGNPARIIKYRFTEEQIADMQDIAWWDWRDAVLADRKPDFALPIQEFIDKYRPERPRGRGPARDTDLRRILLVPDFGSASPLWERVIEQYCDRCRQGSVPGQLYIYLPEDEKTDQNLERLQALLKEFYDGDGDIYVQVGQIADESELFEAADCYVTTREEKTVYHSCLACRFGVKILSGADMPCAFGELT